MDCDSGSVTEGALSLSSGLPRQSPIRPHGHLSLKGEERLTYLFNFLPGKGRWARKRSAARSEG